MIRVVICLLFVSSLAMGSSVKETNEKLKPLPARDLNRFIDADIEKVGRDVAVRKILSGYTYATASVYQETTNPSGTLTGDLKIYGKDCAIFFKGAFTKFFYHVSRSGEILFRPSLEDLKNVFSQIDAKSVQVYLDKAREELKKRRVWDELNQHPVTKEGRAPQCTVRVQERSGLENRWAIEYAQGEHRSGLGYQVEYDGFTVEVKSFHM